MIKVLLKKILYLLFTLTLIFIISFSVFSYRYNKHTNEITNFAVNVPELVEVDSVVEDAKKLKNVKVFLEDGFFLQDDGESQWVDPAIVIESTQYEDAITCRIDYIEKHNLTEGGHFCMNKNAMMYLIYD